MSEREKRQARKVFFQLFGNKVFLKYAKLYVQSGSVRCKNNTFTLFILFLPTWSHIRVATTKTKRIKVQYQFISSCTVDSRK